MRKDLKLNDFKFWRYLINFWSIFFFVFIIYDFFTKNTCVDFLNILATVYISALAIYVSNKEFERWYDRHHGQHPGEVFVIFWSVIIFSLLVLDFIFKSEYQIPGAVISSYIAVLTILAVTRKSKQLYQAKHRKK
ncbi:MAG: hypothetical protein WC523_05560 [Patescibacteria group bacterium]|jgi:uncharacterized membrane protein YhaH (DUF805 family)